MQPPINVLPPWFIWVGFFISCAFAGGLLFRLLKGASAFVNLATEFAAVATTVAEIGLQFKNDNGSSLLDTIEKIEEDLKKAYDLAQSVKDANDVTKAALEAEILAIDTLKMSNALQRVAILEAEILARDQKEPPHSAAKSEMPTVIAPVTVVSPTEA